jgi:hypothetical protein
MEKATKSGRSPSGRAGRPTAQARAGLGDTATIANAECAVAPESCHDYLTPGRAYLVEGETSDGKGFFITTDAGAGTYCLWSGCAHLRGGNWERSASRIEARSDETLQAAQPVGQEPDGDSRDAQTIPSTNQSVSTLGDGR